MENSDILRLSRDTGTVALMASAMLQSALSEQGKADTKTAKDLSGIIKDMVALDKELRVSGADSSVTVRFEGESRDAAV